jgi:hypothetical protein
MDTILIALAFVGGLAGLIIVGMMVTMYFYTHGALGLSRFRGANGLRALTARSVPFQVTLGAGQSEINLGLSTEPGTQYARGSILIAAIVLLLFVIAVISILSVSIH